MKRLTLFLTSLLIVSGVMAQVDYTPTNTDERKRDDKFVSSVSVNGNMFNLTSEQQNESYIDATLHVFVVEPGTQVALGMECGGKNNGWMNAYVYIDTDMDGFDAGIADDGYTPTGDLVSYSFYNNGADSDKKGWNSLGKELTGDDRSTYVLPDFTAPETEGTYRIRFKYDWCNINPDGGEGTYFKNDFMGHGGAIIDLTLKVETYENSGSRIKIAPSTGTLYKWVDNAETTGEEWNYKWISNATAPQITITSEKERNENNIRENGSTLEFYGGNDDNNNTPGNETFSISVSAGYVITDYGFEYQKASSAPYTATIKIGEESIPVGTEKASFQKENVNSQTTSFTIEEENEGIILSNFYINVKQKEIPSGIEIKATTGTFTESNNEKTYHSKWESSECPGLTLSTSANNMQSDGDYITGASGSSYESTYTITAPEGYVIASYRFGFANHASGSYQVKLSINGKEYQSSSDIQNINVEVNDLERVVSFTQSGDNNMIKFTDFIITLKKDTRVSIPSVEIFTTKSDNVPYRIPAIAQASNGNLIAVADYRHSGQDIGVVNNGPIDLHGRIGTNNGANWGSTFTIVEGKGADSPDFMHVGFGDPCIVADRESDRVLLLSCAGNVSFPNGTRNNHQNIARFYSEDNGEHWSEPEDIAEAIYSMWDNSSNHGPAEAMFIGSGKIHQSRYVKAGSYYRLYCAVLLRNKNKTKTNFVIYSDDFGGSWKVLGGVETAPIPSNADEPKVEELPNGNIILSSRCSGGRHFNIFTFTDAEKAEGTWGEHATSNSSNNGVSGSTEYDGCNGEIMILPALRKKDNTHTWIALQSIPFASTRSNVGIYYKELETEEDYNTPANFAKDWDGRYQVSFTASAYSTMCLQENATVAFLYEENTYGAEYTIRYKNLTLDNITNDKYSTSFSITYMVDGEVYSTEYSDCDAAVVPIEKPVKEGREFKGWDGLPETMPARNITIEGAFNYALTYNLEDEVYKTEKIFYGEEITAAEAPAKEGHTFNGWNELPETMPANDITVNGSYTANKYAVTYKVDGEIYKTDSIAYGSGITPAEAPEKSGHTFAGWKDLPATMPAENISVTGTYTANTYAVTYMVDGEVYKTDNVSYGSGITVPEAPEKEGYTFSCWKEVPESMPAEDITVEGIYTVNIYAVTYKIEGEVYRTDSIAYGNSIGIAEAPVKEGHTFSGWSEAPATMPANDIIVEGSFTINCYKVTFAVDTVAYSSDSIEYGAEITLPEMPEKEGCTFAWENVPATMPAADITLKGYYIPNIYVITYMIEGEMYKTDSIAYGSGITVPEAPEKEGYTFSCWREIPESMPAEDITVEGIYTANIYAVTYKVEGEVYRTDSIAYGNSIDIAETPVKEGYSFSGWSELPATMPANDIIAEGSFTINCYKVTFVADGNTHSTDSIEYGAKITLPEMPEKEGCTFAWENAPATMPAADTTVKGSYIPNMYAVTYMVEGEVYKTDSVAYGSNITPAEAPEKEGHSFAGWKEIPATMPAKDVVIEGSFTVNSYKVTYIIDEEVYFTTTVKYGAKIPVLDEPVKDGCIFSGWSEIPETMPAEDIVITGSFTDVETSIEMVTDSNTAIVYNIKGERVVDTRNLERGLYIINGKVFLVK